ncbi:MAG: GatB/YqeY domain-containing protein [Desulfosarcinaceae bacterium]|nr:GatB/YqeY domain-containing protein [Desulfosarcinaceae bacterium]
MSLQQQLKTDLMIAMKLKDDERKNALRIIMGELGRQEAKQIEDEVVIGVIRKLLKSEKETLTHSGTDTPTAYMKILESYLPAQVTEAEIREWIQANVDFSQYRNKMQAMGTIMQHFGGRADGNMVRQVLLALEI